MRKLISCFLLVWALAGCSGQRQFSPYREDDAVSNSQGVPRDSAASYFPADANLNTSKDSLIRKLGNCQFECREDSKVLFGFKAPVLSNYYLGHSIYRFLWSRAFRLPVLLTLDLTGKTGVLKAQLVNRYPVPMASAAEVEAASRPVIQRINQLKNLIQTGQDVADNKERLASAIFWLDNVKLSGAPLIITEKAIFLSQDQIQQFLHLLNQANFWALPSCEPTNWLDGVNCLFEAHEAHRYKVIRRQNPPETDRFFQCCKFLLNLSPAKNEERY